MLKVRTLMILALIAGASSSNAGLFAQNRAGQQTGKLTPQDYMDIQQLYARYTTTIQRGDFDGWAALFTEDGAHGTRVGRKALTELIKDYYQNRNGINHRFIYGSLTITGTPEGATGFCNSIVVDVSQTPPAIVRAATYDDLLAKTSEGWLFKKRLERTDSARTAK